MERAKIYIEPLNIRGRVVRPQPKGLPVINLSFNELPYPPSAKVQAAIDDAGAKANIYGNPTCVALRSQIAEAWSLNAEQLICGNGSEELLDVIGRVFARTGDEILISEFGYIQFPIVANRVGATLVKARENQFTTSVDALLENVTDKTAILFLANPNNPTGTMIGEAELRRLVASIPTTTVLVIDLAYGEFAGAGYCSDIHQLVSEFDNVIVTQTFSKAYGLAGLRIGWLYAPEWMIPSLYAARGMGTANALGQAAAIAAIEDRNVMQQRVALIVAERERVRQQLASMGINVLPSSANFMMAAAAGEGEGATATAMANHLYDDVGILVNQTREAGLEQFIRFSISLPEHNDLLIASLGCFEAGQK